MAGNAGVGSHVGVVKIAHAGGHALCMRKIEPGVRSQPWCRRSVAGFARHTELRVGGEGAEGGGDFGK